MDNEKVYKGQQTLVGMEERKRLTWGGQTKVRQKDGQGRVGK